MPGAKSTAAVAAVGSLLQGWDNAAVAGALLYLTVEFNLDANPTLAGLVVAATLIGGVLSTLVAGPFADSLGRRPILSIAAILYAIAALVMLWSPSVYVLIFGRFLVGTGIGLAATVAPILISESAPTEIRGQLNTFPYLMLSVGLFLAYCMVFGLSLLANPSWRMILSILVIPSVVYLALTLFYLPESPRWLVSKGRMAEAKKTLQGLRGQEDVSGELALLVEGLGVGGETSIEEWLVKPAEMADILNPAAMDEGTIPLFGPGGTDEDIAWVAQPIKEDSGLAFVTRQRSAESQGIGNMVDNMVSLMGSLHPLTDQVEFPDEEYEKRNIYAGDEESALDGNGYSSADDHEEPFGGAGGLEDSSADHLNAPLLRKRTNSKPNLLGQRNNASGLSIRSSFRNSFRGLSRSGSKNSSFGVFGETVESVGVGGGWQLAWRTDGEDGRYERVFLLQEGGEVTREGGRVSRFASHQSLPSVGGGTAFNDGEAFQAVALIAPSVQFKDAGTKGITGPATVHPSETATKGPAWSDLLEPGVKRALVVGVGISALQQLSGITSVLYYTPQILQQAGADATAASVGLSSDSLSILASLVTSLLMIPSILVAMWLMDRAGRRQLLLTTMPILALSLVAVVLFNILLTPGIVQAIVSFLGVATFSCFFVTGFGPIPSILSAEIFPTRVRGLAIGISSGAMWGTNVVVTYSFPVANATFGLKGVFLFFALVCVVSWIFVFLKVPETKGLPLEIICEFFAMAAQSPEPKKPQRSESDGAAEA